MYNVYVLYHPHHINDYKWEKEIAEIKQINPDIILCLCMEEFDYIYIFNHFYEGIKDWVLETNTPVKVLVPNPNNHQLYHNIVTESTCGYYAWAENILLENTFDQDINNVTKVFTCYNNNPKFERALLVDELVKRFLLQHGVVTFKYPDQVMHEFGGPREFGGWKYHDGTRLSDEEDFVLNASLEFMPTAYPKSYASGFVDLVTESSCLPNNFFCTEKTVKSVNALRPFICLANPHYHRFLSEEYGLELYDELFDYSFDSVVDLDERILLIVDNIEQLVQNYNTDFRDTVYTALMPKLLRNRQRMIDYGNNKEKMIPKSFKFLFNDAPYTVHGHVDPIIGYKGYYKSKGWL
jgi:hypothetical protein